MGKCDAPLQVESPSLEVFKGCVDVVLGDIVYCGLGNTGLTVGLDDLKVLFQRKRFYDKITFPFPEGAVSKFSIQYSMFCKLVQATFKPTAYSLTYLETRFL